LEQRRLYHVQNLAYEIMDEMNGGSRLEKVDLKHVVDHLSRAIGSLADPSGTFSLDYVEERIAAAHYSVFKNEKKLSCLKIKSQAVK
jgi:hypothetical protein